MFVSDPTKLEEQYAKPAGKSLFGGSEAGKSFAKFIEGWANNTLAGDLRPLILPKVRESSFLHSSIHQHLLPQRHRD
jgi:hypothetical protein